MSCALRLMLSACLTAGCGAGAGTPVEAPEGVPMSPADAAEPAVDAGTPADGPAPEEPASLEIGVLEGGAFRPLVAGAEVPIVLGTQGFHMLVLALRGRGLARQAPHVLIRAETADGIVVGKVSDEAPLRAEVAGVVIGPSYFLAFEQGGPVEVHGGMVLHLEATARAEAGEDARAVLEIRTGP